ncbi:uncharacterized protein FOBCDRAFT_277547 [Fusarium oxysporum Fo47]|uniref:Uncharacterized protein n=1 Tax=Fusarium oxysporum Fo47 TaxID=660027 RepID=W9JPX7_FUSOX|nr:uncharacterized protein FOBCDRAFT_277547 [Fusarium oxysporum Fo47]EWZ34056.1 hypothetical protein FOZG_12072 [Fusarium oxysporum Fo47]QKD57903.1 hypothetical protein FOBCDRAFT_277547 [Fusarium oxysporum Fo47]
MLRIASRHLSVEAWPSFLQEKHVKISMPKELFVGAYEKAYLSLAGVTMDDLTFRIPEGGKAGVVSECRDAEFDPKNPDIMVCVGYEPGKYQLEVVHRATDIVLGAHTFFVSTTWGDRRLGPGISFAGITEEYISGQTFGGGSTGPENFNVIPARGTRQIAILFVDFPDGLYPADAAGMQEIEDRWMNEIINGVTFQGRAGVSTRAYYREVSYGVFDIAAQAFGPFHLADNWDHFYDTSNGWPQTQVLAQAAVTAAQNVVDFRNFQSVLIISQTANGQFAWPVGYGGTYSTQNGNVNLAIMSMCHEWGAGQRPDRNVHATVAHELGHNLGLGDQYTPDTGRNTGSWELMNWEDNLPHFTAFHRLTLGWVPSTDWVKCYNFLLDGGVPVNETVTLVPFELGAPAAGRFALIEIRIAPGWNYYIEYRIGQSTQVGDRVLDTNNAIFVTDTDSTPGDAPIARPNIIRVPNDPDGDGSVLINGRDYRETDQTDPTFPTDFRISVSGIDGTKADIKIEYGVSSRPDPLIRPWPAGPGRQWQSPDIEVRNVRNLADPAWFNVPWSGHDNTVVAKITNNGDLAAIGVVARFTVKNMNVGGAQEVPLGSGTDMHDIPPGGVVEFTAPWTLPDGGHFCVTVRIDPYIVPGTAPPVLERSVYNNWAQSNYDRFISASSSPATREITFLEVRNPFEERTQVMVQASQTNPLYRTYVEHTTAWLEPWESVNIKVMHEFDPANLLKCPVSLGKGNGSIIPAHGDPSKSNEVGRVTEKYSRVPNRASFVGYIIDPRNKKERPIGINLFSGVQHEVVTGRKTKFESFYVNQERGQPSRFYGRVVEDTATQPQCVAGGNVIVEFMKEEGADIRARSYATVKVDWEGRFVAQYKEDESRIKAESARAYYVPTSGYGDCWSEKLTSKEGSW